MGRVANGKASLLLLTAVSGHKKLENPVGPLHNMGLNMRSHLPVDLCSCRCCSAARAVLLESSDPKLWTQGNCGYRGLIINCCSVAQSCLTLCDPVDCSTPGFPVLHYLVEFAQIHVYWVGDAIQPLHSLSSPSPPAFNLYQHQGLSQRVSYSNQVPKYWSFASSSVLPMNTQDWFPLGWAGWISLQSKGLSGVFSNATVQKHQFFNAQLSL